MLLVTIPLKGVRPHPDTYGAVISAGWTDPHGVELKAIKIVTVSFGEFFMDANLDPGTPTDPEGEDDWYVYVGVNGRWRVWESLGGDSHNLRHFVQLPLAKDELIRITVCGFEADEIHDLMGHRTGLSWAEVSDRRRTRANAAAIRSGFLSLGAGLDPWIENEAVELWSVSRRVKAGDFTARSPSGDYRLAYRIEVRDP